LKGYSAADSKVEQCGKPAELLAAAERRVLKARAPFLEVRRDHRAARWIDRQMGGGRLALHDDAIN